MFAGARPGTEADAWLGTVPRWVHSPTTLDEAAEFVSVTAREGLALGFVGGGTELELGAPVGKLDAVLQTARLTKIVEYAPADMIVTAEAGLTLARLSEALAEHRQRLALDPPALERATLGGIIAANSFGPRRARFGSVRDLLIGISVIQADGTRIRGGGKVVKNVAGFDLPKLMCGSLGTLGLIATATFRLHPAPEMERTVVVASCTAPQVRALVDRLKTAQLEPVSVVALSRGVSRFDVAVRFEGFGAGVNEQIARLARLQQAREDSLEQLDEPAAQAWWRRQDEARLRGQLRVKLAALPSHIDSILPSIDAVRRGLKDATFIWYASLGLGFLAGDPSDVEEASRALSQARLQLEGLGGSLVLQAAPRQIRAAVGEWGSVAAAFPVMQKMKERFDPVHRLNPGRFVGGI
ncbi:MAG TPA: FAD-binding oxidoreductase [Myxococcaceae bacterium]|nr:FAD-binding oxidoreductase [Myxococcaceae bacterium]